jgi:hypothetical protein
VSKALGELRVAVADQEAEGPNPVPESHDQVAGLLGVPRAVRVRGHPEDEHPPGLHLHDEQHVQALEEDRVDVEEVAGQQAVRLGEQERAPGGIRVPRGRPAPPGAQDPPHRRLADAMAEPAWLAMDSAVSPGRVLPR